MVKSILYVFDKDSNEEKLIHHLNTCTGYKIYLCPITTDSAKLFRTQKALIKIGIESEAMPYLERSDRSAFSERESFIEFISRIGTIPRLGCESIKAYFRFPDSTFSAWWTSSIVEKNSFINSSYHNFIKLLTILDIRKECGADIVMLDIASRELSSALMVNAVSGDYICKELRRHKRSIKMLSFLVHLLKGLKYIFYLSYKIFILNIVYRSADNRKKALERAEYAAFTYFPLVDEEAFKEGRFVNKYYSALQNVLERRSNGRLAWLAIAFDIEGLSFKESVKRGRKVNLWGHPIYFIEEWIGAKDLCVIFAQYLYFAWKCVAKLTATSKSLEYGRDKVNLWSLFEEEWLSSFAGSTLINGIMYYTALRNISRDLKEDSIVTYLVENKAWERALNFIFHDKKNFRVIGIIHTTLPLLMLQFFDYREDLAEDSHRPLAMPRPDYMACNGRVSLELLRKSGWPKESLLLWYAVRYQYLKGRLNNRISWKDRRNKVLVTLSVNPKEVEEMLFYLCEAFRNKPSYQIIIKEHYSFPIKPLISRLGIDLDSETFIVSDEPLSGILPIVKAMIVTGSSVALESIAFGCPVVIPKLSTLVDMNPLSGISDLATYTNSHSELRDVIDAIMARTDSPIPNERYKDCIENYFHFFDMEDDLIRGPAWPYS